MFIWMIAFIFGAILLYCAPELLAFRLTIVLIFFSVSLVLLKKLRIFGFIGLGFCFGAMDAHYGLDNRWPEEFSGEKAEIVGHLCGLPVFHEEKVVFDFCTILGEGNAKPRSIKLRAVKYVEQTESFESSKSDGDFTDHSIHLVNALSQGVINLQGKVKSPRSSVNFGLRAYETTLFAKRYDAVLIVDEFINSNAYCDLYCAAHQWRLTIYNILLETVKDAKFGKYVLALVLGERGGLTPTDWEILQNTGTTHLVAISGLHVSATGGLVFLLFSGFGRLVLRRFDRSGFVSAYWVKLSIFLSICAVAIYSILAGANVPVLRAFLMFTLGLVALTIWRLKPIVTLVLVLLVLITYDPRVILLPGTWLSFGAVYILLVILSQRLGNYSIVVNIIRANIALLVGMMTLQIAFGLPVSLIAPLANLIVVPIVSLILLPLACLITCFALFKGDSVSYLLTAFDYCCEIFWQVLRLFDVEGLSIDSNVPLILLPILFILCISYLYPISHILKSMVVICLAGVLLLSTSNKVKEPEIRVFDVGQGTSVLINHMQSSLLYDFGPAYGLNSDAGQRVILPSLMKAGISNLAMSIVSHNDLDHRGGVKSVLDSVSTNSLYAGQPALLDYQATYCLNTTSATIPFVDVRFFWPQNSNVDGINTSSNNDSCVLQVSVAGVTMLLPGDIGKSAEQWLVKEYGDQLKSDVLLVAHHGSNTSSSWAFLKTVNPSVAIYSAAFNSRFNHPSTHVEVRFQKLGIKTYNTADHGALKITNISKFGNGRNSANSIQCPDSYYKAYSNACFFVESARQSFQRFWINKPS